MELFLILVFGCVSFKQLVLGEKYRLEIVEGVTEVFTHEKLLGPEWYGSARSKYFEEETQRREWCREGLLQAKAYEKRLGRTFHFQEGGVAEKLKVYVLAGAKDVKASETGLKILMASKCPTSPPTYIYVVPSGDRNHDDELVIHVIIKDSGPPVNYSDINNYHMKFVDRITEATADEIKMILLTGTVEQTLQDMNELNEEERLRMCRGAMLSVPEMIVHPQANTSPGINKYYVVEHKMDRRTTTPTDVQYLIQAFDCSTEPKLYVSLRDGEEAGPILWTMVRSEDAKLVPKFDVMGYSVVLLKSIKPYRKPENENEDTAVHAPVGELANVSTDLNASKDESKRTNQSKLKRLTSRELIRGVSDLSIRRDTLEQLNPDEYYVELDIDQFTEEERRYVCGNAIKAIFGLDAVFTEDSLKPNQYYTVVEELTEEITEEVMAYECPTKEPTPKIYLNIIDRESYENMVVVLFEGKEYFNRLRSVAHFQE